MPSNQMLMTSGYGEPRSRIAMLVILGAAAALYLRFIVETEFTIAGQSAYTLVDDAMISMRYAQHLAAGSGFVWNVGEPPIEGFSNPTWVLVMSALHVVFENPFAISLIMMLLSAFLLLLNVVVVAKLADALLSETQSGAGTIAAAIVAFFFPLVFWSLRGLEVGFVSLLSNLALLVVVRLMREPRHTTAIALATILSALLVTRLDTAPTVGLALLACAVTLGRARAYSVLLNAVAPVVVTGALLTLWRFMTFGSLAPNTYYLKATGVPLAERVTHGWRMLLEVSSTDVWLPLLLAAIALSVPSRARTEQSVLVFVAGAVSVAYSVYVGGDYAEYNVGGANRFLAVGTPMLVVVFAVGLERALRYIPIRERPVNGAVAVALVLTLSGGAWARCFFAGVPMLTSDIDRAKLGLVIRDGTAPTASVAAHAAGQIGYYSQRRSIDLLGKSDATIARGDPAGPFRSGHNKWNYRHSIDVLQPDVVADVWTKGLRNRLSRAQSRYRPLSNGVWVREGAAVDAPALSRREPQGPFSWERR